MKKSKLEAFWDRENDKQHDRLVGIAMELIECIFEVREKKEICGEEYYALEDEIIAILKANKVK